MSLVQGWDHSLIRIGVEVTIEIFKLLGIKRRIGKPQEDSVKEFTGGLLGEGQGRDLAGLHSQGEEFHHAGGQRKGLPASRVGYEHRVADRSTHAAASPAVACS
jgi:hypothetical protein